MSGMNIPLFTKRAFDFDAGGSTIVAVKVLDVSQYTEGTILVRVHAIDIDTSGNKIEVVAKTTDPSSEEPDQDFIATGTAAGTATVDDGNSVGELETQALSANFGAMLEITVVGTRSTGTCNATISADLSVKD